MLEILYRDDYIVAINKPSGLLVHRSPIDRHETRFAVQILRDQIGQFVYPVHRLDKPTSGVLLFALDKDSVRAISEQFKSRETSKTYLAIVRGFTEPCGVIEHALTLKLDKIADKESILNQRGEACKEAQEATTEYERLATVELDVAIGKYDKTRYSLVKLLPKTGRKHQLRRHMKHISHHILGDTKYGRGEHNKFIRESYDCNRLLLHAAQLQFKHPQNSEVINIKAPLDDTFEKMLKSFGWSYPL